MRSLMVAVLDVDAEHSLKVAAGDDDQPVEALLPDRPDPPFRHRVRFGRSEGRADYLDPLRREDAVELP